MFFSYSVTKETAKVEICGCTNYSSGCTNYSSVMLQWKQSTVAGALPGAVEPPKVSGKPDFILRVSESVE